MTDPPVKVLCPLCGYEIGDVVTPEPPSPDDRRVSLLKALGVPSRYLEFQDLLTRTVRIDQRLGEHLQEAHSDLEWVARVVALQNALRHLEGITRATPDCSVSEHNSSTRAVFKAAHDAGLF